MIYWILFIRRGNGSITQERWCKHEPVRSPGRPKIFPHIVVCGKCNGSYIYSIKLINYFSPVGAQLTVWFNGMRTRYGRLSEASKKSGRGAASSLSVRDQWILRTFSFLHSHIVRCPSRQTAKVIMFVLFV